MTYYEIMERNHRFCARMLLLASFAYGIPGILLAKQAMWAATASFIVGMLFGIASIRHSRKVAYYRSRR
jgi:hypothetical protein